MNENETIKEFQEKIGYKFKNEKLIIEALSHSSYANECKKQRKNNERLEFLGDSVLSVIVSDYIFEHFKHLPEGELTKLRASLVCEQALFDFSKKIDLGKYIFLGKGEEITGGRERPSIVSDAFEAVIADVKPHSVVSFVDYKTALQEIIQKNPEEKVEYVLTDESGPDHDKKFTVNVMLNSNVIGTGIGKSKKSAEQNAAKEALSLMGYEA